MSEQESNVCAICGGPLQANHLWCPGKHSEMPNPTPEQMESPLFNAIWQTIKSWDVNVPECYQGYCGANGSHVALILNAMDGHPEPAPKHDGNLGEHTVDYRYGGIEIDKITNDLDHPVHVLLSPKEALSLLAWLKQEETALKRLAKEQDGE